MIIRIQTSIDSGTAGAIEKGYPVQIKNYQIKGVENICREEKTIRFVN